MKTIVRLAIVWAIAGLAVNTVTAQKISQAPVKPNFNKGGGKNNNYDPGSPKGNGNSKWWVSVGVGSGPNWGPPPPNYGYYGYNNYYGGYNNYYGSNYGYYGYNYRKAARRTIRNTGYILYNAIQQANWEGMYNPILSNAVQHQRYAKFLYNNGNYMGALHHSDRARYLAWQSLNFNYGSISNPGYDDWDDDMYGGYYKQNGNNNNAPANNGGNGYYEDDVYKKKGNDGPGGGDDYKQKPGSASEMKTPSNEELDKKIEQKNYTKDELKSMKLKDLDIE